MDVLLYLILNRRKVGLLVGIILMILKVLKDYEIAITPRGQTQRLDGLSALSQNHTGVSALPRKQTGESALAQNQTRSYKYDPEVVKLRFKERRDHIQDFCSKQNLYSGHDEPDNEYMKMLGGHIRACLVPKVGTEYIKALNWLIRYKGERVETGKYMVVAREPYSRLLSAYLDKILTRPDWWLMDGRKIADQFRNSTNTIKDERGRNCGHDISFPEFIKFILKTESLGKRHDRHFAPMYRLCDVCATDFVCRLETFKEDMKFILGSVNQSADVIFNADDQTIRSKCGNLPSVYENANYPDECLSLCGSMKQVWLSFHFRGILPKTVEFPFSQDECGGVTAEQFINVTLDAYNKHQKLFDRRKQKNDYLTELYLQVSLEDRLQLKDLFTTDANLFGYDPQPINIFPEVYL